MDTIIFSSFFKESTAPFSFFFFLPLRPVCAFEENTANVLGYIKMNRSQHCAHDFSRENHTGVRTRRRISLDTGPGGEPTRRCQQAAAPLGLRLYLSLLSRLRLTPTRVPLTPLIPSLALPLTAYIRPNTSVVLSPPGRYPFLSLHPTTHGVSISPTRSPFLPSPFHTPSQCPPFPRSRGVLVYRL